MPQPIATMKISRAACHGNTPTSGDETFLVNGSPIMTVGDTFTSCYHGVPVISQGSSVLVVNGQPVGYHGCSATFTTVNGGDATVLVPE